MNYIEQFIAEQTERNLLAGQKLETALEYIDPRYSARFKYTRFDDVPQLEMMEVIELIQQQQQTDAVELFTSIAKKVAESLIPGRKEKEWWNLYKLAQDLTSEKDHD